jgi:non-ribosomal peptide synthase protein (TIGR01720 family)
LDEDFFALGGDSILSIQIVARVRRAGLHLTPRQLFENPTVARLARVVRGGAAIEAEQGVVEGEAPLTPIQRWFFEQALPDPHHYNQAFLFELRERVPTRALEAALAALERHHDALRLRFSLLPGVTKQRLALAEAVPPLVRHDLAGVADAELGDAIGTEAARAQHSLDLEAGPVWRAVLFECGPERPARLLLAIHHLVVDAVSWPILLEDLQAALAQARAGEPLRLPPKTTSFRRWAERLEEHAQSRGVAEELSHWLAATGPVTPLPLDAAPEAGANDAASMRRVATVLDEEQTRALVREVPSAHQTRIADALLTALAVAFRDWTGQPTLLLDFEGHGREEISSELDLSRTVGWFTTLYPIRLELGAELAPSQALASVRDQLREIPGQGLGYGVLRYLNPETAPRLAARAAAEVGFNYLGQLDRAAAGALGGLALAAEVPGPPRHPAGRRAHLIEVEGAIAGGQLRVEWRYSVSRHRPSTIDGLARRFREALGEIIERSRSAAVELSAGEFEDLLAEYDEAER